MSKISLHNVTNNIQLKKKKQNIQGVLIIYSFDAYHSSRSPDLFHLHNNRITIITKQIFMVVSF